MIQTWFARFGSTAKTVGTIRAAQADRYPGWMTTEPPQRPDVAHSFAQFPAGPHLPRFLATIAVVRDLLPLASTLRPHFLVMVSSRREFARMEPSKPVRLLIVEDEAPARRALGAMLRSHGYRVGLADTAERALEILQRDDPPDAILLDIDLPGMNGMELLTQLQSMAPKVVPVIVSGTEGERVRPATDRGVNFVRKPIDLRELLSVLGRALQRG